MLERMRLLIVFVVGFAATAVVWLLLDRANDAVRPLTLVATDDPPGGLRIEVAGAVLRPGVYELQPGARIADAIEAAGGLTADASLRGVNLAERIEDEERIDIVAAGEQTGGVTSASLPPLDAASPLVDLNSADEIALQTLPGIGPARAATIVASREETGAFGSPDELADRGLVPRAVVDGLRDLVVVSAPAR